MKIISRLIKNVFLFAFTPVLAFNLGEQRTQLNDVTVLAFRQCLRKTVYLVWIHYISFENTILVNQMDCCYSVILLFTAVGLENTYLEPPKLFLNSF